MKASYADLEELNNTIDRFMPPSDGVLREVLVWRYDFCWEKEKWVRSLDNIEGKCNGVTLGLVIYKLLKQQEGICLYFDSKNI